LASWFQAFAAEVRFISPRISTTCASIQLRGEIRAGDTRSLAALIAKNDIGCIGEDIQPAIAFDSPGGDLDEALRIGRLIRSKGLGAMVNRDAQCVSACNIAFLGGVSRSVDGVFGIHRPYALELSAGESDALSKYDAITRILYAYAREMRVSPELFERMTKVSPQDVKFLNHQEMASLGVTGIDAVWEDLHMSRGAKSLGISKQEYIRRLATTKEQCGRVHPYPDPCVDSIMKTGRRQSQ
jgi:hypothetical protein